MATWLKQSTAMDVKIGPFVDATDGVTPETALTITQPDIRLAKNGGAWAQKNAAQTLSHEENGWYEVALDATDTNTLGILVVAIYESGALPVWREFLVVPANVWDSYLGADLLQVDATQLLGTAYATPTVAGVQEVDLTHIEGTAHASTQIRANLIQWLGVAPLALSSQRVQVLVGAISNGVIAAATFAANALGAVWDELKSGHTTPDTFGDYLDDEITSRATPADVPTAAATADAVWDEARSGHVAVGSFGQAAQRVRSGTAQAGAAGSITLDAGASASDSFYNGLLIHIVAGTGADQSREITAYVGATKVATVSPNWAVTPDATSVFVITG